ncbi:tyrosyl-DNA phosphodiesterase [Reticulomyxa filosa]|uniref:Tyrosyl-DNA phosphodiesterase n=1 Tax=Reticulomyxa filosa TaxID=46433 RepID=X6MA56_RETFI|nr:tyrosyl-DNA phosphodiesterase [Reticulomyxa filosa]|eukprot:ETO10546.1 tyrosyl-DNA phosphodiesterase [Reticulomyxa filosa]
MCVLYFSYHTNEGKNYDSEKDRREYYSDDLLEEEELLEEQEMKELLAEHRLVSFLFLILFQSTTTTTIATIINKEHNAYGKRRLTRENTLLPPEKKIKRDGIKTVLPDRPLCQFGAGCYRKNANHFEEFFHPWIQK